jgi:hypothetical protein
VRTYCMEIHKALWSKQLVSMIVLNASRRTLDGTPTVVGSSSFDSRASPAGAWAL